MEGWEYGIVLAILKSAIDLRSSQLSILGQKLLNIQGGHRDVFLCSLLAEFFSAQRNLYQKVFNC